MSEPDDLLTTVRAWLRKLDTRLIATKQPETDTLAVILEDLPCTVSGWLRALLARCEAAEDERDAARAEVERVRADKEGHERVLAREIAGWKGECADLKTQKESDDYLIESLKGDVEIARAEAARLKKELAAKIPGQVVQSIRDDRDRLRAEAARLKELARHDTCHDLVCNGSREHPRGAKGHCCSCAGRDAAYAEAARLRELVAEVRKCGTEEDDPRLHYMTVQIDKGLWGGLMAALDTTEREGGEGR